MGEWGWGVLPAWWVGGQVGVVALTQLALHAPVSLAWQGHAPMHLHFLAAGRGMHHTPAL